MSHAHPRRLHLNLDKHRVSYLEHGAGPSLLLVHGSPVSSSAFRHQLSRLGRHHRVIAPDLLGFGESTGPADGADFPTQAAALRALIDALELASPLSIVAHDWGGPIALSAVSDRLAEVEQLVLVNSTIDPYFSPPSYWRLAVSGALGERLVIDWNLTRWALPVMMRAARSRRRERSYERALDRVETRRAVLALEQLRGFHPMMTHARRALEDAPTEVSIIWGHPDVYFGAGELKRLRAAFPDAPTIELPWAGHFPMEDAPARFGDALRRLLRAPRAR